MSLSKRKAGVDTSVEQIQKPHLKLAPLPPMSALSRMTDAERAKVKELAASHRAATEALRLDPARIAELRLEAEGDQ